MWSKVLHNEYGCGDNIILIVIVYHNSFNLWRGFLKVWHPVFTRIDLVHNLGEGSIKWSKTSDASFSIKFAYEFIIDNVFPLRNAIWKSIWKMTWSKKC